MKRQAVRRPRWILRARRARAVFMADRWPYWRDSLDALGFLAAGWGAALVLYVWGGR